MSETKGPEKFVVIPDPETINSQSMHLRDWLDQQVWSLPTWRADAESLRALLRLKPRFDVAEPGEVVALTQGDHARLVGQLPLLHIQNMNPLIVLAVARLTLPIYAASDEEPKKSASSSLKGQR